VLSQNREALTRARAPCATQSPAALGIQIPPTVLRTLSAQP
jgi:hypothetical protein